MSEGPESDPLQIGWGAANQGISRRSSSRLGSVKTSTMDIAASRRDRLRRVVADRAERRDPKGWYLAREAGWLAGVSGDRIGQWARRGFINSSRSDGSPRAYSFQDVAEAIVVHELLNRGVPHKDIRKTIANSRSVYGDWPLTTAPLRTTTGNPMRARLVLEEPSGARRDIGRGEGDQFLLIREDDLRAVNSLLRRGGWAIRELPHVEHIEVDPDRMSGRPTIKGTRISAVRVGLLAQEREGLRVLRTDYGLRQREIDDAADWYRAVIDLEAAA